MSPVKTAFNGGSASFTIHIDSGLSIRNHEKRHYYPMMSWDETAYEEFAYWEETDKGSIVDFMNFRVAFPPHYEKKTNKLFPAIIGLHGTGVSGRKSGSFDYPPSDPRYDNNSHQLGEANGRGHYKAINKKASDPGAFPGIIIIPQASYNGSWGAEDREAIARFLEWMIENYNVDPDRIAIHGLSNGAKGVWKITSYRPDLFAAALPMSGVGTDIDSMTDIMSTMPMWIFQGDLDSNPSADYSRRWYDSLVAKGGTPRYKLYENTGHGTWGKAYNEPEFYSWMRAQNKKNVHVLGGDPRENTCSEAFDDTVKLGFSDGFLEYQWTRNGEDIEGANQRFITASEEGIYQVKFKRRTDSTWDISYAIDVFYTDPHMPELVPSLAASGPTTLPVHDSISDKSLRLQAEPGFAKYEWYKNGVQLSDSTRGELVLNNPKGDWFNPEDTGTYTAKVIDQNGCVSLISEPITIRYEAHRLYDSTNTTNHFGEGISIRNMQKDHYEPMVEWNDSLYQEFAFWESNQYGYIVDFMNWRATFPKEFDQQNDSMKYPVVVVLHGPKGSGRHAEGAFDYHEEAIQYDNNGAQLYAGGEAYLQAINHPDSSNQSNFPAVVIYPQVGYNGQWGDHQIAKLIGALEWMIEEYHLDPDRIVVHGQSTGVEGIGRLIKQKPGLVAGALLVAGGAPDMAPPDAFLTVPTWIFVGDEENGEAKNWHDQLKKEGADFQFSQYQQVGDKILDSVFHEPDFFSWIKSRDRKAIQVLGLPASPCADTTAVDLGLPAGFIGYQWLLNDEELAEASQRFITANEEGIYKVRFQRKDSTWDVSYAKEILYSDPDMLKIPPSLTATSSTTLPVHDSIDDKSLILTAEPGFAEYDWYKSGVLLKDSTSGALILNNASGGLFQPEDTGRYAVKVTDENGCTSIFSEAVKVTYEEQRYYDSTNVTRHHGKGVTIRNMQKNHYHSMVEWDDSAYQEFALWKENQFGYIVDFMNWRAAFPKGYDQADTSRYPAIVVLHDEEGSGRRASGYSYDPENPEYDNNGRQLAAGGLVHLEALNLSDTSKRAFPGIVIYPQVSDGGSWGDYKIRNIALMLEWMIREYHVDPDRIVVHGHGKGAEGVWNLTFERPDLFAGALFMAGLGRDIDAMTEIMATTPTWIFHGAEDTVISAQQAKEWHETLVEKGAISEYTLYENMGHEIAEKAYNEPDFFSWIKSQDQKNIRVMHGLSEDPCKRTEVVELGISAGFLAYQWYLDGEELEGATARFVTATQPGEYLVRFKRKANGSWGESYPLDISYSVEGMAEYKPELRVEGHSEFPLAEDVSDKSSFLIAEPGFASYTWYKSGKQLEQYKDSLQLNDIAGNLFTEEDTGSYTVRVSDANGCSSSLAEPVDITYDPRLLLTSGIKPAVQPVVYPNPFTDRINLAFPDNSHLNEHLILYDPAGRMVMKHEIRKAEFDIDLSGLPSGIYLLVIDNVKIRVVKSLSTR